MSNANGVWISEEVTYHYKHGPNLGRTAVPIEPLSLRELQVLYAICDGGSNRDAACRLNVTVDTVKYHLKEIFGKLGVRRRTHAVAVAIHLGLIQPIWLPSNLIRPTFAPTSPSLDAIQI